MRNGFVVGLLVAALALGTFGCDPESDETAATGSGSAVVTVDASALSAADIARLKVTVSGDDFSPSVTVELPENPEDVWSGSIKGILAGENRTFSAEAYDAEDTLIYSGTAAGVTIVEGETASVSIYLQQITPPDTFVNAVPVITAFTASSMHVEPGGMIAFTVEAVDADPEDTLAYAWSADSGELSNAAGSVTLWTAPASLGEVAISIAVSDPQGATARLTATVVVAFDGAAGDAEIVIHINTAPEVLGLVPSPTRLDVGESTTLDLSVADRDGNDLSFAWTADCDGFFDDAAAEDPTFTLTAISGETCTLSAVVTDGMGGENTASITIETGAGASVEYMDTENTAVEFDGVNDYVTFGVASKLGSETFTIECWFKREGAGATASTGTGGFSAVPLVTKGRGEADGNNRDMNYFLGILPSSNVLVADFEDTASGLNHPVYGTSPIASGVWYHAAATYDGTTWRLYLNGQLDAEEEVNATPRGDSIQHAALGSALNSAGSPSGYFDGIIDEVRIWRAANNREEIQAYMTSELSAPLPSDLLGYWKLNEGAGALTANEVSGSLVGALINEPSWAVGADIAIAKPASAPAAPSDISVTAISSGMVEVNWTDNADNERAFEIERSTQGPDGPFLLLAAALLNTTDYLDAAVVPESEYCYRVRAVNSIGESSYTAAACDTTPEAAGTALDFGSQNAYVTFGSAPNLGSETFTIECWFKREGAGSTANTGSGGFHAVPLVTKGRGEADGSIVDMNYFFGIDPASNVLVADFEDMATGLNHPVYGSTSIDTGVWYHAAAAYDGTTWRLYLNGQLDAKEEENATPRGDSIQHAGLSTAMTSSGSPSGHFDGVLDEVRIWDYARTTEALRSTVNTEISGPESGLLASWSMNEGYGTAVTDSAGRGINGSLVNDGWQWVPGAPFDLIINDPPNPPVLTAPSDGAEGMETSLYLDVTVSDPENDDLDVTFFGRKVGEAAEDFAIIALPDTQFYAETYHSQFGAQTQWIVDNADTLNIQFVTMLGDCVQNGDNSGNPGEWIVADRAFSLLEDPTTTMRTEGIAYGISVGNHDQSPSGNPDGTTTFYNEFFGENRFTGGTDPDGLMTQMLPGVHRSYYGGHYGEDSDSNYQLFSGGGMDFIIVHLEYDTSPDSAVLDWADGLLRTYSNRRAIVVAHHLIGTGNPAAFSAQGRAVFNALKGRENLFLLLGGHVSGEGRRVDVGDNGNTVYSLLADYQGRAAGGDGWLRILTFSPANNEIRVETFSPTRSGGAGEYETDGDSRFTLGYDMNGSDFEILGTDEGTASGTIAEIEWLNLKPDTQYEWYASVSDGINAVEGPIWSFTTAE